MNQLDTGPKYEACPASEEIDLYSGCSFNCVYCVGRPRHADAIEPLEPGDAGRTGEPCYISPWTDPYQHLEEAAGVTRRLLSDLAARDASFFVVTKGSLVLRDLELFADRENTFVAVSLGTLDRGITGRLEPDAPGVDERVATLEALVGSGRIRTVVKIDPIVPGITDGERLDELLAWLCRLAPLAVTADTLRLSTSIAGELERALTRGEHDRLLGHYPALDDEARHPGLSYRVDLLSRVAARLEGAGIRGAFCRASLPGAITPHDCRGGF